MSVRNRIAMFEQTAAKEGASPEDRGRSPGVSSIASGSDSPRPLSKVRTSFVAIEKDGRIGLQRNPSETSSISTRKFSGNPEAASTILQETTRTNVSSPESLRPNLNRSGPSSSALSNSSLQDAGPTLAGQLAPTSGEPTSISGELATPSKPSPSGLTVSGSGPASLAAASRPGQEKGLAESPQITQAPKNTQGQSTAGGQPTQIGKDGQSQAGRDKDQSKARNGSKGPLNQGSDIGGSRRGTGNGTSSGAGVNRALNGTEKVKTSTPALANGKSSAPSSQPKSAGKTTEAPSKRSKTPPVDKKPAPEKKSTPSSVSPGGFVKPRPKSPTRPVKLPPSLTTHTTASGSKTKTGTTPEQPTTKPRSTSRSSLPSSGKSLVRSSSVAGRQRPSIGPPPKQVAKDHPVPKKEAKVDESFLARMMRPTQASASKVAERAPTTPPRKTGTLSRKPSSAKIGATRKAVSKATSATTSSVASPDPSKAPTPAAKEVVPKVEKIASADQAVKAAKDADETAPLDRAQEKVASPKINPKTPEREPVIVEEEEEPEEASAESTKTQEAPVASSKMEDALKALGKNEEAVATPEVQIPQASEATQEASQEPEIEEAGAPLANGDHKNKDIEAEAPAEADKTEVAMEQAANKEMANGVTTEPAKMQELDDEETW